MLQVPKFLLQIARSVLQIKKRMLQMTGCGSLPPADLQHPLLEMLQIGPDFLHDILAMLQAKDVLPQIDLDLQQNAWSGPSVNEWWPPIEEVERLRIEGMLQVDPVLQQNEEGMLQIREGSL